MLRGARWLRILKRRLLRRHRRRHLLSIARLHITVLLTRVTRILRRQWLLSASIAAHLLSRWLAILRLRLLAWVSGVLLRQRLLLRLAVPALLRIQKGGSSVARLLLAWGRAAG